MGHVREVLNVEQQRRHLGEGDVAEGGARREGRLGRRGRQRRLCILEQHLLQGCVLVAVGAIAVLAALADWTVVVVAAAMRGEEGTAHERAW